MVKMKSPLIQRRLKRKKFSMYNASAESDGHFQTDADTDCTHTLAGSQMKGEHVCGCSVRHKHTHVKCGGFKDGLTFGSADKE